jgi:iron(II)-dependent oxidoreductase
VLQAGVFASRFPGAHGTLWTMVNRNEYDVTGGELEVASQPGMHYYDLWHGAELAPVVANGKATLSFDFESLGYGAILASAEKPNDNLRALLAYMAGRSKRPLSAYSQVWKAVPQTLSDGSLETLKTVAASSPPDGMIRIPEGDYDFKVSGIEIEGGNDPGLDVQYPWENMPRRFHRHRMYLHSFYIDRTPVTNAEFSKFVIATHYRPKDDHNFLRGWPDAKNGIYPQGSDNKPVTWVSIEDARAYAAWSHKRLPHEWEWQYAAQSTDGRTYPWGNDWRNDAVPPVDSGPSMHPLSDVAVFPKGASLFGVLDLIGNVSQWTDEYIDAHTRTAIVRGGAAYQPSGSIWYFPQTYRLDEHEKYLLMSPGHDRAGTVGFRCVIDAQ